MPSNTSHLLLSSPRPRRVEPVCSGLQAQILRCYRDHLHEVLLCSDLVKAYQDCVSTARKVRLPATVCKHETSMPGPLHLDGSSPTWLRAISYHFGDLRHVHGSSIPCAALPG